MLSREWGRRNAEIALQDAADGRPDDCLVADPRVIDVLSGPSVSVTVPARITGFPDVNPIELLRPTEAPNGNA